MQYLVHIDNNKYYLLYRQSAVVYLLMMTTRTYVMGHRKLLCACTRCEGWQCLYV